MVSVIVVTYNQEQWIRQTLDSILAQQTIYPFEVIIGEDHGTDGTRAICQEYAKKYENVILVPSERNVGVTENWIQCVQAGSGKYIMNCAGDDYWQNLDKIQLQVDYMERHPECVLCHTDYNKTYEHTSKIIIGYNQSKGIVPPQGKIQSEVLKGIGCIAAVTQCIRRDMFEKYVPIDKFVELQFSREDWPTQLILSAYGEVHYLAVSTSTYRVGQESITRTKDYEKIRQRYEKDKVMTEYLYSLFPQWGTFSDAVYFDAHVNHALLLAAYDNNDYASACIFRKNDTTRTIAKKMAYTWLTFQIYRLKRKYKE